MCGHRIVRITVPRGSGDRSSDAQALTTHARYLSSEDVTRSTPPRELSRSNRTTVILDAVILSSMRSGRGSSGAPSVAARRRREGKVRQRARGQDEW